MAITNSSLIVWSAGLSSLLKDNGKIRTRQPARGRSEPSIAIKLGCLREENPSECRKLRGLELRPYIAPVVIRSNVITLIRLL